MSRRINSTIYQSFALALIVLLTSVPALAGLTISGANGITVSGADGILYQNTNGITVSGADGLLAFNPNGITVSGADGITVSGADGITVSGADGITASGADAESIARADGITVSGADGITVSGADGTTYKVDSVTIHNPTGITVSGADNVIATGANGITASGADTRNIAHADGITVSGADNTLTINGADGIIATGADGAIFTITPSAVTITGVNGITVSGADGITVSGADSFVPTGVNALVSNLMAGVGQTGLQSVDPELAVLLNRATDDSNIDAVIVYHHLPTDSDITDLQNVGVLGGTRYHVLPVIAVTTTKSKIAAISHLPAVRSIYMNRTFQWNLEAAARSETTVDQIKRNNDLTTANHGLAVSGRGVTVAVLDTGVDGTHADLSGRVVQNLKLADTQSLGVGFNYPVASTTLPNTDQAYGHGTFVAGVIAGTGQQSNGKYAGVAPGANILGLSAGDASLLFVLSGFDYLLANGPAFNVRVVNCSFSANTVFDVNDPVNIATKMLTDNGVNVVFSAGNTGPGADSLNPYAIAPWVISTGATDDAGKLATFSSRGEFGSPLFRPTIVAPGVNTVSLRASTLATVTTIDGLGANDSSLSATDLPYYTTGSGTSFSAPQVAGTIALMLEANPNLTPAKIRDILQRTATPLLPYYMYEVGAGMLNAQAAVLEAAFAQRHFGSWRGAAYQGQVAFSNTTQTFAGGAAPGSSSDSSLNVPANALLSSIEIAWGDTLNPNNLTLSLLNSQGTSQAVSNSSNAPGLTGRRQRIVIANPVGAMTARVQAISGSTSTATTSAGTTGVSNPAAQSYSGVARTTSAQYPSLTDTAGLDSTSIAEMNQSFRFLLLSPFGSYFRPASGITRAAFAAALVQGARVPQYLPVQAHYTDVNDRATMLFIESAQASPNGALFPAATAGGAFQPDAAVDRLTAAVALVRADGLRQQAESGSFALTYLDAASIPASLRGYVALAVQNGLIKSSSTYFNPQGNFTRMDLAHALAAIAAR
ncbi:MAG TPA: S8 family serine peptidase [Pyrinomonadaceae bacterium]|jgi:serine protease AprX|nr:S8 family serine peptidase [Pyrinomonadaceae bacterium]